MTAIALAFPTGSTEEIPQPIIQPVKALKVSDAKGFMERKVPGQARAAQEVNLSFRVSGPLITRPVIEGDGRVLRGLLIALDTRGAIAAGQQNKITG